MPQCPPRDQLSDFLNGSPVATASALETHIASCVSCQQILEMLRATAVGLVADNPTNPSSLLPTMDDLAPTLAENSAARQTPRLPLGFSSPGYEILDELGRGGMGVVYKARQLSLNRLVALKIILQSPSLGDKQLSRFTIEAELLAQLQHPNIVQVFETGQFQETPYLSMEYLSGVTLSRQLETTRYGSHAAAALVETLARAMFSAHQRGVLHRDLKPSNVLFSAEGEPKITDFGLAKRVGDESHLTIDQTVLGTPSYMPPEQAQGNLAAIGPRSDVYSLGAILYEMLTGRPPFRGSTALETIKQVVSREPDAPRAINRRIPLDIETICLKCLQKQPESRYQTAEELADDLQRFQRDEPILARRIGTVARVWRWCRRNPALSMAIGLFLITMVIGTFGIAWQFRQASRARRLAEQRFERFQVESSEKLGLIQDLMERVPEDERQQNARLQSAVASYEQMLVDEPTNAAAQASYAESLFRVADIRLRIGQFDLAEEMFLRARRRYDQMVEASPANSIAKQKLAETLTSLGESYRENGKLAAALDAYGESMRHQADLSQSSATNPAMQANSARTLYCRSLALLALNRTGEAEQDLRGSIELLKRSLGYQSSNADLRQGLARSHINLGVLLRSTNRPKEALPEYSAAIGLLAGLEKVEPQKVDYRFELATARMNLANALQADVGQNQLGVSDPGGEAEINYRLSIKSLSELSDEFANIAKFRKELANSWNGLGALLLRLTQTDKAEEAWQKAAEEAQELVSRRPDVADYHALLARTTFNLAFLQQDEAQAPRRAELLTKAVSAQSKAVALSPTNVQYLQTLQIHERSLARVLIKIGKYAEAAETAEQLASHARNDPQQLYAAATILAQSAMLADRNMALDALLRSEVVQRYRSKVQSLLATCRQHKITLNREELPGIDISAEPQGTTP